MTTLNLSRKELIEKLNEFRNSGKTLEIKLNASFKALEAEYTRLDLIEASVEPTKTYFEIREERIRRMTREENKVAVLTENGYILGNEFFRCQGANIPEGAVYWSIDTTFRICGYYGNYIKVDNYDAIAHIHEDYCKIEKLN